MTVKALKQPATEAMAELKLRLQEVISNFEYDTGELVNSIELQGGERTGPIETTFEIDVFLEASAVQCGVDFQLPVSDGFNDYAGANVREDFIGKSQGGADDAN